MRHCGASLNILRVLKTNRFKYEDCKQQLRIKRMVNLTFSTVILIYAHSLKNLI